MSLTRSAVLTGFDEAARDLGLDPVALIVEAGLPAEVLTNPNLWVPSAPVGLAIRAAAAQSGAEDLGLRIAAKRRLSNLGPLALLARSQPTLGLALEAMSREMQRFQNQSLRLDIVRQGPAVELRLWLVNNDRVASPMSADLGVGVIYRNIRELLDSDWLPQYVCFRHASPKQPARYREFFNTDVLFDQEIDGFIFASPDLNLPIPGADHELARTAQGMVEAMNLPPRPKSEDVEQIIRSHLTAGATDIESVSRALGLSRRTLHRELAKEKTTFEQIVDKVRTDLARHYVQGGARPFAEVADMLGFSSQSAFTHWYRARHRRTPSDARREEAEANSPGVRPEIAESPHSN